MEPLTANDPREVGGFELRARLGAGGMGQVYLGASPAGRAVAIKVVHPELLARDPEFLHRFAREVEAARAVSGVYTAPVVGFGLDNPPWLATAYVPGPSLADVVRRHGPLPESAVWRLGAGLAEALLAVHAHDIVHRDLKPANVLLAADGPHVIDFGISRALEGTTLTSAGMVVGTPEYMSPEQANGKQAGPASDIFSLGCVLAYAATGATPFGGGSTPSILYRVAMSEPDLTVVPARLRQVITACLAKRPEERPDPAALITMISATGPIIRTALGAFWPEPVASIIAADQPTPAAQTAQTASPSQGVPSGGFGGGTGPTGDAPMVPDGYYTAATSNMMAAAQPHQTQHPVTERSSWPPWPGAGAPPQTGGAQQRRQPPDSGRPQSAPWEPGPQPQPQTPGGPRPWPQQQAPFAQPPLARYTPGHRRPMKAEVPSPVLAAIRLMYAGAVGSLLNVILGAIVEARDDRYANNHPYSVLGQQAHTTAGDLAVTVVLGGILGIVCWLVVATSCRRGRGWTRIAGTVLLALYTVGMLIDLHSTSDDPGVKTVGIVVLAIGIAAAIPLWGQQARAFFLAWRRR